MTQPLVAIVHLGRRGGRGAHRRLASLEEVFRGAGADVLAVSLRGDHRAGLRDLVGPSVPAVMRGDAVPETLSWSRRSVMELLEARRPRVVVCETLRSYSPAFLSGTWNLIVDFVDELSVSYRDRARILGKNPRSLGYRALATSMRRTERHVRELPVDVRRIAAGWSDAEHLGAEWVPITVAIPEVMRSTPDHDLVFFGTLSYPPNVAALEWLAMLWPALLARRPLTTALVAGADATPRVRALATDHGWTLIENYSDVAEIAARARVSVVPLRHASGLQIKVLEAAAAGLPQVVSPAALGGFAPGFPVVVGADDQSLVDGIVTLVDAPDRDAQGAAGRDEVRTRYSVERWVPWAEGVIEVSD